MLQYGACFERVNKLNPWGFVQYDIFPQADILGQLYNQIEVFKLEKLFVICCGENPHVAGIGQPDGFRVQICHPDDVGLFCAKTLTEKGFEKCQTESTAADDGNMGFF